jgi:hypothetical protein
MFSDHLGLGKRHNAQGPQIDWTRGLKFRSLQQIGQWDHVQGSPRLNKGIMFSDHHDLGKRDNAQGPPTVGQGDHDQGTPRSE